MTLDSDAVDAIAGCISRGEHVTVSLGDVLETEIWCGTCAEFTQVKFAMKGITDIGVYDTGAITVCPEHEKKVS